MIVIAFRNLSSVSGHVSFLRTERLAESISLIEICLGDKNGTFWNVLKVLDDDAEAPGQSCGLVEPELRTVYLDHSIRYDNAFELA